MIKNIILMGVVYFTLVSCASALAPSTKEPEATAKTEERAVSQEGWERDWQKTLAAAKREGKLSIYSTGGADMRQAVSQAFKEKFGLDIEWTAASVGELAEKILRERRAGLYLADAYLGGSIPPLTVFKPGGILEPIKPVLVLPEVLDEKAWYGGQLPWLDKEKSHVITSVLKISGHVAINTDMVKPEEISSYDNLLEPRWKGKIIMDDPSIGAPHVNFGVLLTNKGPDFMRKLAENRPALVGDFRLALEWVARGKYLINLTPRAEIVAEFIRAGAPLKKWLPQGGAFVSGTPIAFFKGAPHPDAARVFINWFLSKEGNYIFSRIGNQQAAREDVPTDYLAPEDTRDPAMKYFNASAEEYALRRVADDKLLKEIFGAVLK